MNEVTNEHLGIVEATWTVIEKGYSEYHKQYPELIFHAEKRKNLGNCFKKNITT